MKMQSPDSAFESYSRSGTPNRRRRIPQKELLQLPKEYVEIAALDPLGLDQRMRILPLLNEGKAVGAIIDILSANLPEVSRIESMILTEAHAATRDMGMLMASVKRHGVEPANAIPGLEPVMLALANKTGMIPRETIMHYSVWNPDGERRRTFIGSIDEHRTIESLKIGVPGLEQSIRNISDLYFVSPYSEEFSLYCDDIEFYFTSMIDAIVYSVQHVSPRAFALEMRPYYDPIIIGGQEYMGVGPVNLPIFVFDLILWASEVTDRSYKVFREHLIPILTPQFREIFAMFQRKHSLVRIIGELLTNHHEITTTLLESAESLNRLLDILVRFRNPHKRLAERAFEHLDTSATGSSGYRPDILGHIADLTAEAKYELKQQINFAQGIIEIR